METAGLGFRREVFVIYSVKNCSWRFAFQCPRQWNTFAETDSPDVRFCDACMRQVHLCHNELQLKEHSERGECVALGFLTKQESDHMLLGRIVPRKPRRHAFDYPPASPQSASADSDLWSLTSDL